MSSLDELEVHVNTLSKLLQDRHPGLHTWNSALDTEIKSIMIITDVDLAGLLIEAAEEGNILKEA